MRALQPRGYEVAGQDEGFLREWVASVDPAAALSLVNTFVPEIAILDIGLPVMDGYQLAGELRAKLGSNLHLLALSGYAQERDMRRSLEVGFVRHLVKPADIERLLEEIACLGRD